MTCFTIRHNVIFQTRRFPGRHNMSCKVSSHLTGSVLSRTHRLSYAYDPMRSTRPPSLVLQLLHPYHVTITCILDYYYQCYPLSLHPITRPHTNVACYFKRFIRQLSPHRCSYEGGLATGR